MSPRRRPAPITTAGNCFATLEPQRLLATSIRSYGSRPSPGRHPNARRRASPFSLSKNSRRHSRGAILPGVCRNVRASEKRGRRESRAPTAPAVPCAKNALKEAHGLTTGTAETSRLSPRNGFNGFLRALPGEAAFLAPVVSAILRTDVAPGSRRQDHTTSPSASGVSSARLEAALTPLASTAFPTNVP